MFVWSGYGFLVAVFVFGSALACNFAFDSAYGEGYYSSHQWAIGVAILLAAVPTWLVGAYLRSREAQVVVDKATGEEIVLQRGNHSLFFIPMHLWGPILIVVGVGLCVFDAVT